MSLMDELRGLLSPDELEALNAELDFRRALHAPSAAIIPPYPAPAPGAPTPTAPAPSAPTPAELLELADGPTATQRVAEAMRTGNQALVAQVRAELGL